MKKSEPFDLTKNSLWRRRWDSNPRYHLWYTRLRDQTACASGGIVAIDFADNENPVADRLDFNFAKTGYSLCIVDTGADHANLTGEYASITVEMKKVAEYFGKSFLNEVSAEEFF